MRDGEIVEPAIAQDVFVTGCLPMEIHEGFVRMRLFVERRYGNRVEYEVVASVVMTPAMARLTCIGIAAGLGMDFGRGH